MFTGPIHVAVCDTPGGKYEYYGAVKTADGKVLDQYITFDPAVFNDNGKIWLYYGWSLVIGEANIHARMTEDAEAELLEEAVQTSYRKGGIAASITEECVSKDTVMNKLHALQFPKYQEKLEDKKVVDYLYIDADEDHVSLQFREKKGDLIKSENHPKNNNAIAKLVYVYEGIEREAPQSKRHKPVNPYYFSRVCDGEANQKFWDEIKNISECRWRSVDHSRQKKNCRNNLCT